MKRNQDGWIEAYERKGSLWIHDGNPRRPHALLRGGEHSSGFFNSDGIIEDACLLDEAAGDLVWLMCQQGMRLYESTRVVGPAMGAITLAHDLARWITVSHQRGNVSVSNCMCSYVMKEGEGDDLKMVFKRSPPKPGEIILLCEDVLTTGGSVKRLMKAVEETAGNQVQFADFVAVLVNRSGLRSVNGKQIVALIDKPMPKWKPEGCPLCAQGSEAISPKGENWARLNAEY